jgi:signal transduction histidine kinase/CheY-like chemotaxis protein
VAAGAAFALEQQVSRSLSATYTLAALVLHDPRMDDFDRIAARLLQPLGGVASLQLAPGAVVSRIHPLAGNEAAIGHDLLKDPERRLQAMEAVKSRKLTVAGPFELRQGGVGLVGRLAVFTPDPAAPGGERFWGLVMAVVRLETLVQAAQLRRVVDAGFAYQLIRFDPERGVRECFAECDSALERPVTFDVAVPNGAWTLAMSPRGGWPGPPWRVTGWLAVVAAAAAIAFLALRVLGLPAVLQREVEARTAELARANVALAEDMQRLRAAEEAARTAGEQLRHAQKMEAIGQLAGGIAHDFNNLLTGILGQASVLAEESPPGSEARAAAETITATARRAAELTRRLLGFARRDSLRRVPLDAHAVIAEATVLLGRTLDARLRLVTHLDAPRATVVGDAAQLQQALLNLAFNARDAMPEGGELRIETAVVEPDAGWLERHPGTRAGPHLTLAVSDTGKGIRPELHARVFEPFFTTKAAGHGTGLGLALVYGIARAHGGAVELESPPGRGARFVVSLPLAPPGIEPGDKGQPRAPPRRGGGWVLVIDDDEAPRDAAVSILRARGYQPMAAASAEEGLAWFRGHAAEVRAVLLDVVMPGMDGLACREALLGIAPGARVVFMSGYAGDGRAQALAARGDAGFLAKPFDPAQLVEAIEAASSPR